jgi:hypothetical protein
MRRRRVRPPAFEELLILLARCGVEVVLARARLSEGRARALAEPEASQPVRP